MRPRRAWLWGLGAALVLGAVLAWPRARTVDVVLVQEAPITQSVVATGRIATPARIALGSALAATVLEVAVREGDLVRAGQVLLRMESAGQTPDDRVQNAVARSRPVKAYVDTHWPAQNAGRLVFRLLGDPGFLAEHADGLLSADEQRVLGLAHGLTGRAKPPRSVQAWKPSLADLVLIDEVADLLNRTPSLGHVIIDEAQDLSAMGLRAVGRRASTGSVTVLGDLAQATTAYATNSWADSLEHLGKSESSITELVAGFRVPRSVIEYAARLLPSIAPSLTPPHSVRRSAGDFSIVPNPAK